LEPRCDDGSLPSDSQYNHWYHKYLIDATARAHRPIAFRHDTRHLLERAGFVDIQISKTRLPIGEWAPNQIDLGRWYRLGITEALEALSLAPFCRSFGWPVKDVRRYVAEVDEVLRRADIHAYNDL